MLKKIRYADYKKAMLELGMKPETDCTALDHFMFENGETKLALAVEGDYPRGCACVAWIDWISPRGEYDGDDSKQDVASDISLMLEEVKSEYGVRAAWTTLNVPPYRLKYLSKGEKLGWEHGMCADDFEDCGYPIYSPRADGYVYFAYSPSSDWKTGEELDGFVSKLLQKKPSKTRSYLDAWRSSNPDALDREEMTRLANAHLEDIIRKIGEDRIVEKIIAATRSTSHTDIGRAMLAELADYFRPGDWWRLIPARTYKAILSRQRDLALGKRAYGVSEKTLRDCLDKICWDYHTLKFLYSYYIEGTDGIECANEIFYTPLYDKLKEKGFANPTAIIGYLFEYAVSYIPPDEDRAGEAFTDTPYTFEKYETILGSLPEEPNAEQMVVAINKCIDVCHNRGPLAWAFVEGGEKTCAEASGMKPDEIYESRRMADVQMEYWAHMLDGAFGG